MRKILVSGYHGFNNLGDEAILESILSIFRRAAEREGTSLQATVLSANPRRTMENNGVHAVNRVSLPAILSSIWRCDLFVSGGGGLLQDKTGYGLSVLYYLGLVFLARILRKPIVFYAHGIGPITKKINRFIARWIINRVDFITVRDMESRQELISLGVKKPPLYVTVDPAFFLTPPEDAGETVGNILSRFSTDCPLIGISVRDWQGNRGFLQQIARAADLLVSELQAEIIFIPMFPQQDLYISHYTASLMKHDAYVLEEELRPREVLSLFSRFDLFIGVRLHSLIFASMVGTPPVGVGYDPKVHSFLSQLGLNPAVPLEEVHADELFNQCVELWEKKDTVSQGLSSAAEQFRREAIRCGENIYAHFFNRAQNRGGSS